MENHTNSTNITERVNTTPDQYQDKLNLHFFYGSLIVLSATGIVANSVSLLATTHIPKGQTTHSKLIVSLALSDMSVVVSMLIYAMDLFIHLETEESNFVSHFCKEALILSFNNFSILTTLFNLIAMAIDHYVFIIKPLHYTQVMTKRRGNVMILILWVTAFLIEISSFFVALGYQNKEEWRYCYNIWHDHYDTQYITLGMTMLCVLIIACIYIQIYVEIHRMHAHLQEIQQDYMHNKKAIITTVLIIGSFMLCWLPNCLFQIYNLLRDHLDSEPAQQSNNVNRKIFMILFCLQILNTICDPIIYAIRLKDVQDGYRFLVRKYLRKLLPSCALRHDYNSSGHFMSYRRNTVRSTVPSCGDESIHVVVPLRGEESIHPGTPLSESPNGLSDHDIYLTDTTPIDTPTEGQENISPWKSVCNGLITEEHHSQENQI